MFAQSLPRLLLCCILMQSGFSSSSSSSGRLANFLTSQPTNDPRRKDRTGLLLVVEYYFNRKEKNLNQDILIYMYIQGLPPFFRSKWKFIKVSKLRFTKKGMPFQWQRVRGGELCTYLWSPQNSSPLSFFPPPPRPPLRRNYFPIPRSAKWAMG